MKEQGGWERHWPPTPHSSISYNKVGAGTEQLAEALTINSALITLELSGNEVWDEGARR